MTRAGQSIWGRDYARALVDQAVVERAAYRVVPQLGPGSNGQWGYTRPFDRAGARRAAATFGFTGGELCVCHEPDCRACACTPTCGDEDCARCVAPAIRGGAQARRVPRARMWTGERGFKRSASPAESAGGWFPDEEDIGVDGVDAWPGEGAARGSGGASLPGRRFPWTVDKSDLAAFTRYDAHAHHFASGSSTDRANAIARWPTMQTEVGASVLMGSLDMGASSLYTSSEDVNDATFEVAASAPSYFAPFCHIVPADHEDPNAVTEITTCVGEGARGVGELYVHAHREDTEAHEETEAFYDIFRTAYELGVPVAVHWDIGETEADDSTIPYTKIDPAVNHDQLIALLQLLEAEDSAPDIILCHCGAGPGTNDNGMYADLETRLRELLTYPNVYFDIAGMQIAGDGTGVRGDVFRLVDQYGSITKLGQMLRDLIQAFPYRFLFGSDVDDRENADTSESYGVPSYAASVDGYRSFLVDHPESTGRSIGTWRLLRVMGNNLRDLIGAP